MCKLAGTSTEFDEQLVDTAGLLQEHWRFQFML